MNLKFVTTEIVTTRTINTVIDGRGPRFSYMSVVPWGTLLSRYKSIRLVIGAMYENASSCSFSKEGLGELIEILKEIHTAMED